MSPNSMIMNCQLSSFRPFHGAPSPRPARSFLPHPHPRLFLHPQLQPPSARPPIPAAAAAPRGPTASQLRHCDHLLFDFTPRYLEAATRGLPLSYLAPQEAGRQGLAGMRCFLDLQVELQQLSTSTAAAAASWRLEAGREGQAATIGGAETSEGLDLVRAAALVSLDPNVQQTVDRVEAVAAMVGRHLKPSYGPLETIHVINSVLYDFYRFSGTRERFYHPEASCLARLLQYKTGSPTLLGILYISVAERVGLRLAAVSLPSQLLLRPLDIGSNDQPIFIDPYNGGALYDVAAVGRLLHDNLHLPPPEELAAAAAAGAAAHAALASGGGAADENEDVVPLYEPGLYGRGFDEPWFSPYLVPVGRREVLLRLLRNLREVYWVPLLRRQVTEPSRAAWLGQQALSVLRMLRLVEPHHQSHVVAEGLCLAAVGRGEEGRELLRGFLRSHPEAMEVVQTLYSMEAEAASAAALAALHQAQRDKEAREAARARSLRARLAGLKGFNGRDPNAVLNDPSFFSRMYGRLWDDNYWVSAMLEHQGASGGGGGGGEEEEEDPQQQGGDGRTGR